MGKVKLLVIILLVVLLSGGCRSLPVSPIGANSTTPATQPTTAPTTSPPSTPPVAQPMPDLTNPPSTPPSTPPPVSQPPPVPAATQGNQVGNLAPDFQLQNLDGQIVSLADLRGKPVLINFWATWCPPCRLEMPYLQQIYDSWSAKGLVLLAVDIGESPATIEKFLADNNLSLPVLLDINKKVALTYGITAIPTTFLIDKNGVIQGKVIGAFPSQAAIEQSLSKIIP